MKILIIILLIPLFLIKTSGYNNHSYIVIDSNTNMIIEGSNYNSKHLTASISKILTAIIIIENSNLDDLVKADKEAVNQIGSSCYLKENEYYSIRYLLYGLMLRSGNDCANLLARNFSNSELEFSKIMNEYARMLNMNNSNFENPSGLDYNTKNYSTCYDMAILMSYCLKNEEFRKINQTKIYETFYNKHRLINQSSIFTGGKTGYTKLSGRTLITSAKKNDLEFICVSFEVSDDFNFHKNKLINLLDNYKLKKVKRKTYIKQNIKELSYILYHDDIVLPINKYEKFEFVCDILNEELLIYNNSNLIYKTKLKRNYLDV